MGSMQTTGCANPLCKCDFHFWHSAFYFYNTCSIFSNKISTFRTWSYRLRFAFRLNLQPPDSCRCRIGEVGFSPGSLSLEISIFCLRYFE